MEYLWSFYISLLYEFCVVIFRSFFRNSFPFIFSLPSSLQECEELMSRGVTGSAEGFDLPGRRLGGFSRQPAISSLRNTAIAAAQKRQRLGSLLPSGPKRLGGDSSMMAALTPGQAAAMAAERRLQDEIWCASGHAEVEEGESSNDLLQKHVNQGAGNSRSSRVPDGHKTNAISRKSNCASSSSSLSTSNSMEPSLVDLTTDSLVSGSTHNEDSLSRKRNYRTEKLSNLVNGHQSSNFVDLSDNVCSVSVSSDDTHDTEESTTWECVTCTLLNPVSNIIYMLKYMFNVYHFVAACPHTPKLPSLIFIMSYIPFSIDGQDKNISSPLWQCLNYLMIMFYQKMLMLDFQVALKLF